MKCTYPLQSSVLVVTGNQRPSLLQEPAPRIAEFLIALVNLLVLRSGACMHRAVGLNLLAVGEGVSFGW